VPIRYDPLTIVVSRTDFSLAEGDVSAALAAHFDVFVMDDTIWRQYFFPLPPGAMRSIVYEAMKLDRIRCNNEGHSRPADLILNRMSNDPDYLTILPSLNVSLPNVVQLRKLLYRFTISPEFVD
jgi:hypothetical protein